jgi:hypothetical protein
MARSAAAIKFVSHSHRQTIENIIKAGDVQFLHTLEPEKFAELLFHEVEFLLPHSASELADIKQYIRVNRDQLYRYMLNLAPKP